VDLGTQMISLAQKLMMGSAAILFVLGSLHLLFTFRGNRLFPRDTHLERQMHLVAPVLTRRTTMWDAWIGFNASHSAGAMFFGLVYGYLALRQPQLLFRSVFLIAVGLALLGSYCYLAQRYWFRTPLAGILLSTLLYVASLYFSWEG
jgi:hypothetical protein